MQQTNSFVSVPPPPPLQARNTRSGRKNSPPPRYAVQFPASSGVMSPPPSGMMSPPPPAVPSRFAVPAATANGRTSQSPSPAFHASRPPPPPAPVLPDMMPPATASRPHPASLPSVKHFSVDSYNANLRNEDRSIIDVSHDEYHLFGVFDGHGGPECSVYIEQHLAGSIRLERQQMVDANPGREVDWTVLLKQVLVTLDDTFITDGGMALNTKGSCVILCVVTRDKVFTANIGDSRAVLGTRYEGAAQLSPRPLSVDQDCQNELEVELVRRRSRDENPVRRGRQGVAGAAPLRVGGSLMVTRAMGDSYLKREGCSMPPFRVNVPYITAEPIVTVHDINLSHDVNIVLGSDGLYNMLTNDEVVQHAHDEYETSRFPNPNIPMYLINKAMQKVSISNNLSMGVLTNTPPGPSRRCMHDDITCIHIQLGANAVWRPDASVILSQQTMKEREAAEAASRRSVTPTPEDAADVAGMIGAGMLRADSTIALETSSQGSEKSVGSGKDDAKDKAPGSERGRNGSRTPPPRKARSAVLALLQSTRQSARRGSPPPPPSAGMERPGSAPVVSSPVTPATPATPITPVTPVTPATPITPGSLKRSAPESDRISPAKKRPAPPRGISFKKPVVRPKTPPPTGAPVTPGATDAKGGAGRM